MALHVEDLEATIDFYRRYCGLEIVHERGKRDDADRVVWIAEPGRSSELVLVVMEGGERHRQADRDYGHLGFAVEGPEEVLRIAELARAEGRLAWEPTHEPYPVGFYCGVRDPRGAVVEFSFGQPLGPGAEPHEDPLAGC